MCAGERGCSNFERIKEKYIDRKRERERGGREKIHVLLLFLKRGKEESLCCIKKYI